MDLPASRLMPWLLPVLAALAAGTAAGQDRFRITAVVEDEAHRAVPGAVVRLVRALGGRAIVRAITDEDGAVDVRVPAGAYHVYVDSDERPTLWAGPVEVSAQHPEVSAGRLTVRSGAKLAGRVRDREGRPIGGARVDLPRYLRPYFRDRITRTTTTDAAGRFELHGLPTNEDLRLTVWHAKYPHRGDRLGDGDQVVRIPHRFDGRTFTMHDVVFGDPSGTLILDPGDGDPRGGIIRLDYGGPEPWSDIGNSERVDNDGPVVLDGLRPGFWRVFVTAPKGRETVIAVTIASGEVVERAVKFPKRPATDLVRVPDPGRSTVPVPVVERAPPALIDTPSPSDDDRHRIVGSAPTRPDAVYLRSVWASDPFARGAVFADGRFVVDAWEPGTWTLHFEWSDDAESEQQVVVVDREIRLTLDVTGIDRYTLAGRVHGAHESARSVRLSPSGDRQRWTATLDHRGRFEVDGLEAGTYTLRVEGREWGWILAERVVDVPTTSEIDIELATSRVSGTVRDVHGAPLPANVLLFPAPPDDEPTAMANSGCCVTQSADGAFDFDGVPAGRWLLTASGLGRKNRELQAKPVDLVIDAGAHPTVQDLVLPVPAQLTVRSQGATLAPVHLVLMGDDGLWHRSGTIAVGQREVSLRTIAGRYTLMASNDFGYEHRFPVVLPGRDVRLPEPEPRGRIVAMVPGLFDSGVGLFLRLQQGDSVHKIRVGTDGTDRDADGAVRSAPVAPGEYSVRVITTDGRVWSAVAIVKPFALTKVTLR